VVILLNVKVGDFSEVQLIRMIYTRFSDVIIDRDRLPFGDDAFLTNVYNEISSEKSILINVDMLVESTDIIPQLGLKCAGWKFVTMVVSDLAAKGAIPKEFILSLGLPKDMAIKDFEDFLSGIHEALKFYNLRLIGGDLNESKELIADGFVIGYAPYRIIRRKGIKPGDILATTGVFGVTGLGFKIFLEKNKLKNLSKEDFEYIKRFMCRPIARVKEGVFLSENEEVVSAIDSSDGLVRSIYELIRNNENIGFIIDNVPIDEKVREISIRNNVNPVDFALYGGEEFEIIFAVKRDCWDNFMKKARKNNYKFYKIGEAIASPEVILRNEKGSKKIVERGWIHFKNE